MDVLDALQNLGPIAALRASTWTYPAVNAVHIIGLSMLFGAILPLDLRMLGVWRSVPLETMARILVPLAATGFVIAAITGTLLFAVSAVDYAQMDLFLAKMALVALALINAAVLRFGAWRDVLRAESVTARARLAGAASLLLWVSVIFAGRAIGYIQ